MQLWLSLRQRPDALERILIIPRGGIGYRSSAWCWSRSAQSFLSIETSYWP